MNDFTHIGYFGSLVGGLFCGTNILPHKAPDSPVSNKAASQNILDLSSSLDFITLGRGLQLHKLHIAHCILQVANCTLHNAYCILHNAHCTYIASAHIEPADRSALIS